MVYQLLVPKYSLKPSPTEPTELTHVDVLEEDDASSDDEVNRGVTKRVIKYSDEKCPADGLAVIYPWAGPDSLEALGSEVSATQDCIWSTRNFNVEPSKVLEALGRGSTGLPPKVAFPSITLERWFGEYMDGDLNLAPRLASLIAYIRNIWIGPRREYSNCSMTLWTPRNDMLARVQCLVPWEFGRMPGEPAPLRMIAVIQGPPLRISTDMKSRWNFDPVSPDNTDIHVAHPGSLVLLRERLSDAHPSTEEVQVTLNGGTVVATFSIYTREQFSRLLRYTKRSRNPQRRRG